MIKKFLKTSQNIFVLLVITGIAFSNVPFNVFTGLIDSYENTSGIVDKIWNLEQSHDSNIVDKFASVRSMADKFKIHSAMAAVNTDAVSESHTGITGSTSAASFTWNHTPVGTPRGVLVFVFTFSATKYVTSVTYGGTAMTAITSAVAVDTTGEPGRVDTFFLGSGIGTGVKPVVVNRTNNTTVMYAQAMTQTAAADTEVYEPGIVLLQNDRAYAVQSVTDGSTGVNSIRYAACYSGGSNILAAGTGSTVTNSIDFGLYTFTAVKETTAGQGARNVGCTYATTDDVAGVHLAVREKITSTTTLSNLVTAEPGDSTIAPGASAAVDSFGLATNTGTDTVTGVDVGLAAGMGQYIQTVAITNSAGTTTYCSGAPTGDTASLSGCTIPVTTTNTEFDIKITADPHNLMPAPPGGTYGVTGTITGWTGTNATQAGTDSGSSTVTIDNLSPNGATAVSGTAGNALNNINWTTSNSADFDTTNGSVVLRWASGTAGADVPAEGTSTYTAGNTIGGATVACVISSAASTAQSKVDGTGGSAGCTTAALTNGQAYTYKVFQMGTNSNYDVGVSIGTFTPVAPAATITMSNFVTGEPGDSTIPPGNVSSTQVDSFGIVASSGTDTLTGAVVTLSTGMGQYISQVSLENAAVTVTYCTATPSGDTATLSGCTLPVTTTNTQFNVRLQTKAQNLMPAPPGGSYSTTGRITSFATTGTKAGSDSGSSTLTVDNLSPNGATSVSGSAGNTLNNINWTTSNSADFNRSVILRWASGSAGVDVPEEGTVAYTAGNTIGGATVACVISSAASTAQSKVDGTGGSTGCTTTALTNGQPYTYKVFQKDTNFNYDVGVLIGTFTPSAPVTITMSNYVAAEPGNFTIAPGASAQVDSFGIVASSGTDTLTNAVVTMTTNMGQYISNVALTDDGDTLTYCNATPSGDTATFTGCTLPVTTTNTQFKVRLTAKSHALMPAPGGGTYAIGATVTSFTVTGTEAGTDSGSSTTTIDNLSPGATTGATATPGNTSINVSWTNPADADFQKVIIYCKTSAITESPTEGTDPAVDGTACDGTARVKYSGSTSPQTFSSLTNGTTYYFRIYARDTNGNFTAYASTQQVSAMPVALTPTLTSYTNTTETALNSAASCTACGARIGSSSKAQSITITGTNFGTDPGAANRSTTTNNIKVGTHQIASANVTAWSDTSITFLTNSATTGDTDTSWGTNFGGASALTVTAGSQASAGTNFYIFPQITSISTPSVADAAREYNAGDSDGVITLNGTRFGTALGSGSVSVLGSTGTTTAWGNTAITIQVPTAISDSTNTGSIILTQGTGSNGKTNTYTGFRILPRITSMTPSSASIGDAVTINGNHLCQSGTCPGVLSSANKVTFTTATDATVFTSWSATSIVTAVPTGTITGNAFVTSATSYTSNISPFAIVSAIPYNPTSIGQFKDVGFTQSIVVGGMTSSKPVYLQMTMLTDLSGGTLYPQVEYKPIGTPFVCTGTSVCADAVTGTGVAGPGPTTGSVSVSPTDNTYHWQARVKHTKNATDYYSAWVSFDYLHPETDIDFQIDTTTPGISSVSSGTPGTNGATITWSTASEISTSQVQYNKTGTFVDNCATNNDCTSIINITPMVNSHSVSLSNLNSGTSYSYRVRSKDAAGNETIDTTKTFSTQVIANPNKTIKSFIDGASGSIDSATTYHFTVDAPENLPVIQNAYVEVLGLASGGTGTVTVKVNNAASRAYEVTASSPTLYRFLYQIPSPNTETNLNLEDSGSCTNGNPSGTPPCNKLILTPDTVSINVLSAKIITTYSYLPSTI